MHRDGLAFQWNEWRESKPVDMLALLTRTSGEKARIPYLGGIVGASMTWQGPGTAHDEAKGNLLQLLAARRCLRTTPRPLGLKSAGYLKLDIEDTGHNHGGAAWRSGGLVTPRSALRARV